jgi:hypothetical protein
MSDFEHNDEERLSRRQAAERLVDCDAACVGKAARSSSSSSSPGDPGRGSAVKRSGCD